MNKIFIAIIMVLMFGCENKEIEKKDDILEVRTLKIVPKDINLEFSYPARLKSIHKVDIYARVEGLLIEQFFKEDSIVKEGEKLFKIDPTNYQNIVDRSKADLSNAEANFTKQKRDFERVSKLYKQGIFTIDIYDESKYNYENAKAQLKSARANLANALLDLSYTDIVASISGKVGIRNYDTMNLVGQNVNSVLTTITQLSPIYAEFSIPFSDFSYFNDTNNINITLSDDKSIKGKLDFIDSILDENTMTLRARAVLDNDDFKLLPIQFVYLNLSGFWVKNAISISQSAIGQDSNSSFVFVLENIDSNKEGSVSVRKVELGKSIENNEILINSGLKAGDIVIIDSLNKIKNNDKVKVREKVEKMESIDSKNDALRLDTSGLDRNLDSKYNLVLNKDLVKIESKYLDSTDSNAIADSSIAANFVDSIIAAFRDIKFSVLNMQDTPYYSNAIIKS